MSGTGQYIYTVIIAAILVSVLQTILPGKGTAPTMIKLTTGVFLFTIVIAPIVKIRLDGVLQYISNIETDASAIIAEAENTSREEIAKVIMEKSEEYILNKASDLGVDIQVEIAFQKDTSFIPQRVKIIGAVSPLAKKQLSAVIEKDLGISEDLQTWVLA